MADAPNSSDCLNIPVILAGQNDPDTRQSCSGSLFHDAWVNLSPKVAKVEVLRQDGEPDSGSAFFVGDGTHMVTNNHVVQRSSELHIRYNGKDYQAIVEKADDINDLAELKVLGLDADPSRSQKLDTPKLAPNERVMSVGVPGTQGQDKYLNPGVILHSDRLYNILKDPAVQDPEAQRLLDAYNSSDPVVKQQAQDRANAPRYVVNQGARPGESGMPLEDADGSLVGVVTSTTGNNVTLAVPYTKVQELVNSTDNKYTTNYTVDHQFKMPELGPALADTVGLGVDVAGFLGKGRLAPVAYAGVRGVALFNEIKELTGTTDAAKKHELETNIVQDGAMIAGGTLASLAWNTPVGRYAGLGLMGLSLASRFVTDSQADHYVRLGVTRKDGDPHKPWVD